MAEIIGPTYPWSEIVKFIWYRKLAVLVTSTLSGEPRGDPLLYASDDKYIYITLIPKTRKIDLLRENKKVAVAIHDPYNEDWTGNGSIIIRGEAEFIEPDSEEYEKVVTLMKEKYVQVERRGGCSFIWAKSSTHN
jgi:nitroimidazol reductase NimA-like FMN-containing flavoprotein (pyridoxamine 5'-phosphate oxidase superfamily)